MKQVIKIFSFFIFLLIWFSLNGWPEEISKIFLYVPIPLLVYLLSFWLDILPKKFPFKVGFFLYFIWLIKEIIKSSWGVIKIIWARNLNLASTFEWIESEQINDIGLILYGNSITLTPGTITCDIKNNMLLIHGLEPSSIKDLKKGEMDKKVLQILAINSTLNKNDEN